MLKIISLTGNMGVGKDTMADYMVKQYGYVKISMADPFKRMAKEMYDFSDRQLWGPSEARNKPDKRYRLPNGEFLSARIATQFFGSEGSRALYPDIWIDYMKRVVKKIKAGAFYDEKNGVYISPKKKSRYAGIIISSCRFQNEIQAVKDMKGATVRLVRPTLSTNNFVTTGLQNHDTETAQLAISDNFFDYVLEVPEGKKVFQKRIDEFVANL